MSEKQRGTPSMMPLQGFLPRGAIVMAKRGHRQITDAKNADAATLTIQGDRDSALAFVHEDFGAESRALLHKMIEAMGTHAASVLEIRFTGEPAEHELDAPLATARFVVALGEGATRALARFRGGASVVRTHHPRELLQAPALKKDTWNELKNVAKALGLNPPPPSKKGA